MTNAVVEKHPICLVEETTIAGTSHVKGIADLARTMSPRCHFTLEHDVENIYDEWAVKVLDADRNRIGYVSCAYSEMIARLLDGGKWVCGCLTDVTEVDGWTRIGMAVYLND